MSARRTFPRALLEAEAAASSAKARRDSNLPRSRRLAEIAADPLMLRPTESLPTEFTGLTNRLHDAQDFGPRRSYSGPIGGGKVDADAFARKNIRVNLDHHRCHNPTRRTKNES